MQHWLAWQFVGGNRHTRRFFCAHAEKQVVRLSTIGAEGVVAVSAKGENYFRTENNTVGIITKIIIIKESAQCLAHHQLEQVKYRG